MVRLTVAVAVAVVIALASVAAGAQQRPAAEKASDPGAKMICKRFMETGSLVKGYRTCKTKREWEGERDNIRTRTNVSTCNSADFGKC